MFGYSVSELRAAVQQSNYAIVMMRPGNLNMEVLSSSARNIECKGSQNM